MAVHDSRESWEAFRDQILMPRLQAGIEGGFTTPPDEVAAFDVETDTPRSASAAARRRHPYSTGPPYHC